MGIRMVVLVGLLGTALPAGFAQGRLLVAQKGLGSLGIVDPAGGKLIASVPEGGITGHEVAASHDGRLAYVPIYGNSGVGKPGTNGRHLVVVDLAAEKVVGNLDFGHEVRPHLPVFGPKDGLLYVTTELDHSITVVDPKTLKIVGSIPTGQPESHMLAISHDGRRGYTANVGPGTVSVLDMAARKTLKIIPISGETQRISISMDDKWVFTADQKQPRIAVIDTATNAVAKWVPLEGVGYGSVATPDGRWLLMTEPSANKIAVVDLKTMQVVRSVETPADPEEVIVQPNGKTAWVSCPASALVAEIDLANWKVTRQIVTGKSSDGLAWAKAQ
jgi:DNA-binding beta-propeller fold protein YncE